MRNEPGFCLYATTRFGKSSVINDLLANLKKTKALVPYVYLGEAFEQKGKAPKFFRGFHPGWDRNAERLQVGSPYDALIADIRMSCDSARTRKILLIVDEAQALDPSQYEMLKKLSEDFNQRGYMAYVLLVGQPELRFKRLQLKKLGMSSIVGRFFLKEHRLRGLQEEDLPGLFEHYDNATWPAGGPTFTASCVPELVKSGWCLAHQVKPLWAAFVEEARKLRMSEANVEIGTDYAARAAVVLLDALAANPARLGSRELYKEVVAVSGFAQSLEVTGGTERDIEKRIQSEKAAEAQS
jgi:hypothetical protein